MPLLRSRPGFSMCSPRAHLAALHGVSLGLSPSFSWAGAITPLGILTVAYSARLNDREAFPDLSLFDDETLSTEPEGRLAPRAGQTAISLGGSTVATLHLVADGTHVDLARGVVFFKVPAAGKPGVPLPRGAESPSRRRAYRIRLDSPAGTATEEASGAQTAGISGGERT